MRKAEARFGEEFAVAAGNARSQAATMMLPPGESTGGPDNRHPGSDQWLYVVSGEGEAVIDGEKHVLAAGTLLLVERGEAHEIRNTGTEPLRTVDFYVPPAYTEEGEAIPGTGE